MRRIVAAPGRHRLVAALLGLGFTSVATASCGLEQCPAEGQWEPRWLFSMAGRQVGYDLGGESGDYRLLLLRAEGYSGANWRAGAWLGLRIQRGF